MRARCVSRSHLTLPRRRRRRRKWFDGWDPRDVTRRILVKQTRLDGNSKFNTSSSIPLPRPRLCARVTQCHCDSAEILMEYRERSNDGANVLHYCPLLSFLPITVPIKGGGIHRFFSFFLSLFFFLLLRGWICKGGEPPRLLTSFLTSAIHSRRRRGWLGKRFHLDAHLVEKIFHGIYYGGDVMSPFVPWKERWYLRNKRSRLNALLAIRAINGASTLISCLRYLHPPSPRQWWVSDINTGLDVFALIDFRLSLSPSIV